MALVVVIALLAALELVLLLTGSWVLVGERRYFEVVVEPTMFNMNRGLSYEKIECSFFTGRSVQRTNDFARTIAECPFVIRPHL